MRLFVYFLPEILMTMALVMSVVLGAVSWFLSY